MTPLRKKVVLREARENKSMYEKWNRAIKFLEDRGHKIGPSDGEHVIVDERSYLIGEVHELAERWYPDDWIKSENAYLAALLGEPKTT